MTTHYSAPPRLAAASTARTSFSGCIECVASAIYDSSSSGCISVQESQSGSDTGKQTRCTWLQLTIMAFGILRTNQGCCLISAIVMR